jgi:putative aldouronate transport system permease protein
MILPAAALTFLFSYVPMVGIIIAFQDYRYDQGLFGSRFVGLKNLGFFLKSGKAWALTKNTIFYNLEFIIINTFLQILFAIIIFELTSKVIKKIMQSTMILPYFISWVIVGGFAFNMLNYEFGTINTVLVKLGFERFNAYSSPGVWPFILPVISAWKSVGYGSIIYLSAISGIDKEMYESAYIDGAGIYKRIWHITLPMLLPTVVIMTLLSLGWILRGNFEMFYQLVGNNGQLFSTTDVIDTYVFRTLVLTNNGIGSAAASGLYQQVIGFCLVLITNGLVRKYAPSYELF